MLNSFVASAPETRALFEAALAAIPAPAFVTDAAGALLEANPVGRLWLQHEGHAGQEVLHGAVMNPRDPRFAVTPVVAPDAPMRWLVVMKPGGEPAATTRIALVAHRWSLTTKQRQVLELLVEGVTTRTAAAVLGISERGVEQHITAMFGKAQVESRAELCSAVWRLGA
jgi:DNA-binding CsgD family transcriptional regulator